MNILFIEDDEQTVTALSSALTKAGISVMVAKDGKEALEKFTHAFDLVLLDILLPGMNGFEVLKSLREEQHATMPIIMLSNLSHDENIVKAMRAGANGYLVKGTMSIHTIVRKIQDALERSKA